MADPTKAANALDRVPMAANPWNDTWEDFGKRARRRGVPLADAQAVLAPGCAGHAEITKGWQEAGEANDAKHTTP